MNRVPLTFLLCSSLLAGVVCDGRAQAVAVTLSLDSPTVGLGAGTTLRVFAQVVPAQRPNADRIFSWYLNVLNTNGAVAAANYAAMQKTTSDEDPYTSSAGFTTNGNRFGIYDTFLNLPGAGVSNTVELMAIPVTGVSAGITSFQVTAGSGVPALSEDFIVAPLGGGDPLTGGDYSAAAINLEVIAPCELFLQITRVSGGGPGQPLLLTFPTCAGYDHTVQTRNSAGSGGWVALPGGPHNSGSLFVTNTSSARFFRVMASPQ
jgi:hypothetical protein